MKKVYLFILLNFLILAALRASVTGRDTNTGDQPSDLVVENLPLRILAYPNPTKDRLFVESELPFSSISVYNLLGQKLKHFSVEGLKTYEISVSDLASGTYIVTAQIGNQTVNQKFTKID